MCLLFIFNIISWVGTSLVLFRHDSWLSRSFWKMSQGSSRGSLVRYPKGVKIKEKQHLDTLEQKSSKKLTGSVSSATCSCGRGQEKRGDWKISLRVREKNRWKVMTPLPKNQNLISGAAPPGEYASGADKPSASWLIWDSSPQGL